MATVEWRVKKIVGELRGAHPDSVELGSRPVADEDLPTLVSHLTEEFGTGIFRKLIPSRVDTVRDLVDAIRLALEAGPRWCTCSNPECDYSGPGTDGDSCPTCSSGKLICKVQ